MDRMEFLERLFLYKLSRLASVQHSHEPLVLAAISGIVRHLLTDSLTPPPWPSRLPTTTSSTPASWLRRRRSGC